MDKRHADTIKVVLLIFALAIVPLLIWYLFGVVLMAFGAIILAMLVRLGAAPLIRWARLPEPLALLLSALVFLAVIGGTIYVFGTHVAAEMRDVIQRASTSSGWIESNLRGSEFGDWLLNNIAGTNVSLANVISRILRISTGFIEALIIVLICGVYIAAQPRLYRDGLIQLFPPRLHVRAAEIIDGIGEALRLWLVGQLIEMVLIGSLSAFAVWIIGVPSPLALRLIAGVGEFIPYLGPLIAAVPAILVALTKSPEAALWILGAYLVIHQIEGQLVTPLIQRRMISIPPAIMLLGVVSLTYLFGLIAVIFAAPIVVVIFAAVNLIYVRDTLGEKTAMIRRLR